MTAPTARHARRPAPVRWTPRARRLGTTAAEGAVLALLLATVGTAAVLAAPAPTPEPPSTATVVVTA